MTVKELRQILEKLDDNIEVKIGYAEQCNPIKFIVPNPDKSGILLHNDIYMANPIEELVRTIVIYGKFNKEV